MNTCDNTFYDTPGSFTSPGYPQYYPHNSFCQTRITVEDGNRVLLLFRDFSLELDTSPSCSADYDTVRIYDSNTADEENLIAVLCGENLNEEAYITTGRNMLVVFKSDTSVNARGFDATFDSVPGTFSKNITHLTLLILPGGGVTMTPSESSLVALKRHKILPNASLIL